MMWNISTMCTGLRALLRSSIKKSSIRSFGTTSWLHDKKDDGKSASLPKEETAVTETADSTEPMFHRKDDEIIVRERFIGIADDNNVVRETPGEKIERVIKHDIHRIRESFMRTLGMEYENKSSKYTYGTIDTDVLIIGGGSIGSSIAYWITKKAPEGMRVLVIERDMTYKTSATNMAVGGLHHHFSQPECVEMSQFGFDFINSMAVDLKVEGLPDPSPGFVPYGHLVLATEEEADKMLENVKMQQSLGVTNMLLNRRRLQEWFPWLNTDGLVMGCLGLDREGWYDPWMLMLGMKTKAMYSGAEYEEGEVIGFRFDRPDIPNYQYDHRYRRVSSAIVRRPSGDKFVTFTNCVIAAGADSGYVAKLAGIGLGEGVFQMPLPIERRKRYIYHFHSPNGPCMNTPMTHLPENVIFRRENLFGDYVAAVSPDEEPGSNKLTVEGEHFREITSPSLGTRVPTFANAKLKAVQAGFYEHNPIDMHGVIGHHPMFNNVYFACGFNSYGNQHAPALGRAIMELLLHDEFKTLDLSRFAFSRFAGEGNLLRISSQ